jgi:hypothetical protein
VSRWSDRVSSTQVRPGPDPRPIFRTRPGPMTPPIRAGQEGPERRFVVVAPPVGSNAERVRRRATGNGGRQFYWVVTDDPTRRLEGPRPDRTGLDQDSPTVVPSSRSPAWGETPPTGRSRFTHYPGGRSSLLNRSRSTAPDRDRSDRAVLGVTVGRRRPATPVAVARAEAARADVSARARTVRDRHIRRGASDGRRPPGR